ncbi:MAG: M14 family metallopeptidase [bacterium]|nr:M14 family metallopeptidase [bacterium]
MHAACSYPLLMIFGRFGTALWRAFLQALVIAMISAVAAAGGTPPPVSPYEASGGRRTPRYDETISWLQNLAAASPLLEYATFGTSPEGRPLPLVVADLRGRSTAEALADRGPDHAVVLVQACIHAGESCGKDAGMVLLRDLATDRDLAAHLLRNVTLLFIPIFNVDGHERFSAWGRINQNGPEEMGWRVNAANLNLNRDYLKADTVEMRAWLALWRAWLPDFFIDVHSTDGADYQYALTYSLETHGNLEAGLTAWTLRYEQDLKGALAAQGWPIFPYVMLKDWADPTSGLVTSAATPRFSQGYVALQNRPGLLVEAHMLKDYATRVEVVGRLLRHSLGWLSGEAKSLRSAVAAADAFTAGPGFRATPLALDFALTDSVRTVDFLGVGASEQVGAVTGGRWFRFDGGPQVLPMALQDQLAPSVRARLPEAYLLPPAWGEAIERLEAHGVVSFRLSEPVTLPVRSWRLLDPKWQERPNEGHHPVKYSVEEFGETRTFPAGTVVVDLAQRAARVAAHLLDPQGPDALSRWGFFDAAFERVEYVESYVIEEMIPRLLAENPGWAAELEARKAASPEFAADPWAIRQWFYTRTPWWDGRAGVHPAACLDARSLVDGLPGHP